jgi:ABC-type multidrug transport system ATPase subunit
MLISGIEVVALPEVLFLDEPTSGKAVCIPFVILIFPPFLGLDSTSSLSLLNSLKAMCERGMTIAAVIHQPRYSLFMQFDNLILVGKGEPVYVGLVRDSQGYFEKRFDVKFPSNENPADYILDLVYEKQNANEDIRFDRAEEIAELKLHPGRARIYFSNFLRN